MSSNSRPAKGGAFRSKQIIETVCAVLFLIGFMLITAQWVFAHESPCRMVLIDGEVRYCCPIVGGPVHCQ